MDHQDNTPATHDTRDYAKRTPRELAFKAIISERIYQDEKYGVKTRPLPADATLAIQFADKLEKVKAGSDYDRQVMEIMRELAGICVRAMEQHGVADRIHT